MPTPKSKKISAVKKEKTPHRKKEPKKVKEASVIPAAVSEPPPIKKNYLFAVGRRKSSVARVRFYTDGSGAITVNGKPLNVYFPYFEFQQSIMKPLVLTDRQAIGTYSIKVTGGGTRGQTEAVRLGISRIQLLLHPDNKPILKANGLLRRDSRIKERKKYGLRKARRAPQWQKR